MTPVPLDLPLRPSEAAELASLVFDLAENKPLTDEVRNRGAARAAPLRLQSLTPYFGSLSRDPVHHSTYYIAVDVAAGPPWLLHMASAAAPTSGIFPKPLLIGRMRRAAGPEIIVNAIPFDVSDTGNIEKFSGQIDRAFVPRAQGFQPSVVGEASQAAFDAFRGVWKRRRKNVAAVAGPYYQAVWCAIRSGWREGYSAVTELSGGDAGAIREFPFYSRFTIAAPPAEVARMAVAIRQARSAAKAAPAFDLGISMVSGPTEAEELAGVLQALKEAGYPAQIAAPRIEPGRVAALAAVARQFHCLLSVSAAECPDDVLALVARETAGRFSCTAAGDNSRNIEELAEIMLG